MTEVPRLHWDTLFCAVCSVYRPTIGTSLKILFNLFVDILNSHGFFKRLVFVREQTLCYSYCKFVHFSSSSFHLPIHPHSQRYILPCIIALGAGCLQFGQTFLLDKNKAIRQVNPTIEIKYNIENTVPPCLKRVKNILRNTANNITEPAPRISLKIE